MEISKGKKRGKQGRASQSHRRENLKAKKSSKPPRNSTPVFVVNIMTTIVLEEKEAKAKKRQIAMGPKKENKKNQTATNFY